MVSSFLCLSRTPTVMYDDYPMVFGNLWKERRAWACLSQILYQEGGDVQASGRFCLEVLHAALLLGLYIWVMTPHMEKPWGFSSTGFRYKSWGNSPGNKTMGFVTNLLWKT